MKVLYIITALLGNKMKLISDAIPISATMQTFALTRLIKLWQALVEVFLL
jgi:hypothetical protein